MHRVFKKDLDLKKMLFITKNFPPEIGGGIRRIEAIYNLLLDRKDMDFEVITSYKNNKNNYDNVKCIKQLFFKDRSSNDAAGFKNKKNNIKLFDKALLGWLPNVLRFIIFKKYDFVFTSVPSFTNLVIGYLYKKLGHNKTRLIVDYRDFFSFNPSFINNLKKKIFNLFEKKILKKCDYIIVTTNAMKNILCKFTDKKNIFLIKNYMSCKDKKTAMSLKRININKSYFNLGYIGRLNTGRDPGNILQLLNERINRKPVSIHFIGITDELGKKIISISRESDLDSKRIFIKGIVDRVKSLQYMKSFNGLLLIINNNVLIKDGYGIPGKLYDYIQMNNNIFSDLDTFNNLKTEFRCIIKNRFKNIINFKIMDDTLLDDSFNKVMLKIMDLN